MFDFKDKGIYLGVDEERATKAGKDFFKWVKDINEGMWFNCPSEAEKFANSYFKNFKNWELVEVNGLKAPPALKNLCPHRA